MKKSNSSGSKQKKTASTAHKTSSKTKSKSAQSKSGKVFFSFLTVLLVAVCLFIELNPRYFKIEGVPTWNEIFNAAGLAEDSTAAEGELSVHFIDVGQGDCELIKSSTTSVLIDCGEKEYYTSVIQYLKNQGITRLDYVIATHPHSDHIGGMSYILEEFDIGTLIMPKITEKATPTTNTYLRLLQTVDSKNIAVEYAEPGKDYQFDDAKFTVLAPVEDYSDLNNYSVVIKLVHGNNSFLFTGDMESDAEEDLLETGTDVSAEVLKVGHHGSASSSSQDFLDSVNPQYGVIEVGEGNSYGHPTAETMSRLENMNIKLYRTDLNGSIVFVSDGDTYNITTAKGE